VKVGIHEGYSKSWRRRRSDCLVQPAHTVDKQYKLKLQPMADIGENDELDSTNRRALGTSGHMIELSGKPTHRIMT
jgi:hypothetical protein